MRSISLALLAVLCLAACGEEEEISPEELAPPIGVLELPISHRNRDSAPANAIRIEVSPEAIGVDGRRVITLESGRVPAAERSGLAITKLRSAIQSGPARRAASMRVHVNTAWQTAALILGTLDAANISTVAFEVRPGPGATTGWLALTDFDVSAPVPEGVDFPPTVQRLWPEIGPIWEAMYEGCRRSNYVDCDYPAQVVAEGGKMEIKLWARGSALKLELRRFGAPDPVVVAPTGPALIEGVRAPPPSEEVPPPPAVDATFTWRFEAATSDLSPISDAMRPLCGSQPCAVVVEGEPEVMTMRLITFLGAAFPNGTDSPRVRFVLAEPD